MKWKATNQYNAAVAKSMANLARYGGASKMRPPRHFPMGEAEKQSFEEKLPIDKSLSDNRKIDIRDNLVDDSSVTIERTAQEEYYDVPMAEYYDSPYNDDLELEDYGQELYKLPQNMAVNYFAETATENAGKSQFG